MVEMTVGRAGGWYYPLHRCVGCRRWRWSVVDGHVVRFVSEEEVMRFLQRASSGLLARGLWCCLLLAS
jgi:hypothetical protein